MISRQLAKQGKIDQVLLTIIIVLVLGGILAVSSASVALSYEQFGSNFKYMTSHVIYVALGLVAMTATSMIDYRIWRKLAYPLLLVTLFLLLIVLIPGIGREIYGARAWIYLGPIHFQPSELVKFTFLIYLAAWFERQGEGIRHWQNGFLPFLTITGLITALMMLQNDLGSLMIIFAIVATMFFAAGSSVSQILFSLAGLLALVGIFVSTKDYRLQRVLTFLEPYKDCADTGYQICQSLLGIGVGGWWGLGFGQSKQRFLYLKQAYTDSIFVIMAEELGFIRVSLVVALYTVIGYRGYKIAERAPDMFGRLVAVGITSWIVFQSFVHIGGNLSLIPLTGLTLPFISSGGTSIISTLAAVGVLLNISKQIRPAKD